MRAVSVARACLVILAANAASGCAQPVRRYVMPLPPDSPAMIRAMEIAAQQVRRCYRGPRVASSGRQIVTRLRVRIDPDGAVSGLPAVVSQSGVDSSNQAYAARMAEAAIESVMRCAPLRLPADVHRGVNVTIDLTFSPLASA